MNLQRKGGPVGTTTNAWVANFFLCQCVCHWQRVNEKVMDGMKTVF